MNSSKSPWLPVERESRVAKVGRESEEKRHQIGSTFRETLPWKEKGKGGPDTDRHAKRTWPSRDASNHPRSGIRLRKRRLDTAISVRDHPPCFKPHRLFEKWTKMLRMSDVPSKLEFVPRSIRANARRHARHIFGRRLRRGKPISPLLGTSRGLSLMSDTGKLMPGHDRSLSGTRQMAA